MTIYVVLRCWDNGELWEDYAGDDWQYIAIEKEFDAAVHVIETMFRKDVIRFKENSKSVHYVHPTGDPDYKVPVEFKPPVYTMISEEKYEKMYIETPGELVYGAEWEPEYRDYYGNNHMRYYILKVPLD